VEPFSRTKQEKRESVTIRTATILQAYTKPRKVQALYSYSLFKFDVNLHTLFPYQNVIGLEFKSNYEYYRTVPVLLSQIRIWQKDIPWLWLNRLQNVAKNYRLVSPDCRRSADAVGRRDGWHCQLEWNAGSRLPHFTS
jgi:hypothetical protein